MNIRSARAAAFALLGVAVAAFALLAAPGAQAQDANTTYSITIENLTDTQPFTPPVVAAHTSAASIFEVGEAASSELSQIAENGNNDPLVGQLDGSADVLDVATGSAPVMPGESATLTIEAPSGSLLSSVFMLICTNDGFSGVDGLMLPASGSTNVEAAAYDAGSEMNTEDFSNMVPPCPELSGVATDKEGTGESDPALAEGGLIAMHGGIQGIADLTDADHGWTDPVARITIEADNGAGGLPSSGTGFTDRDSGAITLAAIAAAIAGVALVASGGALAVARRRVE